MPDILGRKTRKMVDIDVVETSAVDHPAHLQEGWVVMKSATESEVGSLFGEPIKVTKEETTVSENEVTAPTQEEFDVLKAQVATLETENAELVAKAAVVVPVEKAVDEVADFMKSAPAEIRELLNKQAVAIEKAEAAAETNRVELAKERDARLDEAAIHTSENTFKSLSFNHAEVAPALRRLEVADPATAKTVMDVLKAAEGQLDSAGIFAEIGKSAHDAENTTAESRAMEIAKSLRAADPTLTESGAIAKAYTDNPQLYLDQLEGK